MSAGGSTLQTPDELESGYGGALALLPPAIRRLNPIAPRAHFSMRGHRTKNEEPMKLYRSVSLSLFALCLSAPSTVAIAASSSVEISDLAFLSDAQLAELKDSEFEALRADVAYERSRNEDARFKTFIKETEQREKVAKLNEDAAKLESKAAAKEIDFAKQKDRAPALDNMRDQLRTDAPARHEAAANRIAIAKLEREQASIYVDWRKRQRAAADAYVDVTKSERAIAFTTRDIARIEALQRAQTSNAADFDAGKLRQGLAKEQSRLAKYQQKHATASERAGQERAKYEAVAGELRNVPK